ncbi:MAG: hypothetical protein R2720_03850 [Candidatus Nanopelagicales bacterium]
MSESGTPCPRCGADLEAGDMSPDGMLTCRCGHRVYAGYLREFQYVTGRRQWLWDRVVEQAGVPDPRTARDYGVWPSAMAATPGKPARTGSTQVLLVSLGAGLLMIAGIVFVAVAWEVIGPLGQMAALVLATLLAAAAAIGLRHRVPRTAEAIAVVAVGMFVILAAAAPAFEVLPPAWGDPDSWYTAIICAVVVAWGVGLGRWTGLITWTWIGWVGMPVLLQTLLAQTTGWWGSGQLWLTVAGTAYLVLSAGLVTIPVSFDRVPRITAAALGLFAGAGFTLALLDYDPPIGTIVVVAAALLILLLLQGWIGARPVTLVGWPLFGFWLGLVWLLLPSSTVFAALIGATGVGLLFVVQRWGTTLGVLSAATVWTTWIIGQETVPAILFAIAGLGLFGLALRPAAAPVAWLGALSLETALLLQIGDVPFFEVPTLSLAALLLAAGLMQTRAGEHRSIVVYGPALTAALLPSSLLVWNQVWTQPSLIRFGIVMAAAVAVLLVGVRARMLGLVIPAVAAIGLAATAQIFATLDTLPRWLALGLAGIALITAGARIEWVRGKGREADTWLHSLG